MQDRRSDLVLELLGVVPERLFEGTPVDRDLRRQVRRHLEEPEQIGLPGVLFLHDDGHVLEVSGQIGRKRVQGPADALVERAARHQYFGISGRRTATSRTVNTPNRNPPM